MSNSARPIRADGLNRTFAVGRRIELVRVTPVDEPDCDCEVCGAPATVEVMATTLPAPELRCNNCRPRMVRNEVMTVLERDEDKENSNG